MKEHTSFSIVDKVNKLTTAFVPDNNTFDRRLLYDVAGICIKSKREFVDSDTSSDNLSEESYEVRTNSASSVSVS